MSNLTESELRLEEWCRQQELPFRRIKEAYTDGHRRPDYAVAVPGGWCIVEVKQIEPNDADDELVRELMRGKPVARWVEPGARIRRLIRGASDQLRKFSKRGLPTVALLVDNTAGFHVEEYHVAAAMAGRQKLVFAVNKPIKDAFRGVRPAGGATMTAKQNTSVSGVAVLRQVSGNRLVIDLHHNRYARVPIPRDKAAPFVRKQLPAVEQREKSILDMLQSGELQE